MKGNVLIPVIIIVILVGGLGYAGYMVVTNQKQIKDLALEKKILQDKQKALDKELSDERRVRDVLTKNLKTSEDRLQKAQTAVEERNAKVEALTTELDTVKKQSEDLKKSKDALAKEKTALQAALKKKEGEAAGLAKANSELKQSVGKKDKQISDAQAKIKGLINERDEAKKKADDSTQAKATLTKVHSTRSAWRGTILLESGKHEEALKEFKAAVEGNPANKKAYKGLALCYEALGKKEDATAWWENYIRTGPSNEEVKEARKHIEQLKE